MARGEPSASLAALKVGAPPDVHATQGGGNRVIDQLQATNASLAASPIIIRNEPAHAKSIAQKLAVIVTILECVHKSQAFIRDMGHLHTVKNR